MEKWQDRARSIMKEKGVTQESLKRVLGVSTRGAVGHYLSGRREPSVNQLQALADYLDVEFSWLVNGRGSRQSVFTKVDILVGRKERKKGEEHLSDLEVGKLRALEQEQDADFLDRLSPDDLAAMEDQVDNQEPDDPRLPDGDNELEFFGHMDAWDSHTPLSEDEVELPLFREVELAAGGGATQVIENQGAKLRFAKSTLKRANVPPEAAACAFVRGNSMEPVMPDGTCVGVNTADKTIRDGEIYAIDHGGMLRVKYLHRRPGGGIKIVSQNSAEHPAEQVDAQEMAEHVSVIGRVFWWSVLR